MAGRTWRRRRIWLLELVVEVVRVSGYYGSINVFHSETSHVLDSDTIGRFAQSVSWAYFISVNSDLRGLHAAAGGWSDFFRVALCRV
jgi:hypothetical protein